MAPVNGGANNLTWFDGLIQPKSAELVGNSSGSTQTLGLNGRYGKGHMRIGNYNVSTMKNEKERET